MVLDVAYLVDKPFLCTCIYAESKGINIYTLSEEEK